MLKGGGMGDADWWLIIFMVVGITYSFFALFKGITHGWY